MKRTSNLQILTFTDRLEYCPLPSSPALPSLPFFLSLFNFLYFSPFLFSSFFAFLFFDYSSKIVLVIGKKRQIIQFNNGHSLWELGEEKVLRPHKNLPCQVMTLHPHSPHKISQDGFTLQAHRGNSLSLQTWQCWNLRQINPSVSEDMLIFFLIYLF